MADPEFWKILQVAFGNLRIWFETPIVVAICMIMNRVKALLVRDAGRVEGNAAIPPRRTHAAGYSAGVLAQIIFILVHCELELANSPSDRQHCREKQTTAPGRSADKRTRSLANAWSSFQQQPERVGPSSADRKHHADRRQPYCVQPPCSGLHAE
jgi:hypothetical protein